MSDSERRSRGNRHDSDHDGRGHGRAAGKEQRSAEGADAAAAADHAGPAAAEPLAAFKAALALGDAEAALAAWGALTPGKRHLAKDETSTLLSALKVIGPRAARILKQAGTKPSADTRFCQAILHHHDAKEWMAALEDTGHLKDFLKAPPRRQRLDQQALQQLAWFAGKDAPSTALADAAFEKAWGKTKVGDLNADGMIFHGKTWDRDHLGRMYLSLMNGGIPPAHLALLDGLYIAREYTQNGERLRCNFGYFYPNSIVMPLYKGDTDFGHDMLGGKDSPDMPMGHFQSTALHEVGHLVGEECGDHNWGATAQSPLHMEEATIDEVKKELWDDGKSERLKGQGGKKADPVSAADAQLYLEAEVRGEASSAFASTSWAAAGKSPDQFRKNLKAQYSEQPLYRIAKDVHGETGGAYRFPQRGSKQKSKMFTVLTRFEYGGWAKYNKAAFDAQVSQYSLSSAREWFAEQYQYYMTTGGEATLPAVKTKLKQIMKELDEKAPGKRPPGIRGPQSGASKGGDGGAGGAGKDAGGGSGGAAAAAAPARGAGHRFQIDW